MKTVGSISTIVFVGVIAAGTMLFVRSIPEIRRYLKIREM